MFALVGAVISAIAGIVGSANASATAQLLTYRQENESSIDYTRQKNLTFYEAYKSQILAFAIIAVIGFAFLAYVLYQSNK